MRWVRPMRAAAKNDLGIPGAGLRGYATFACEGMRSGTEGCDVGSSHVAAVCDAASIQSLLEMKRTGRDRERHIAGRQRPISVIGGQFFGDAQHCPLVGFVLVGNFA